jgi:hypothetical protein
LWGRPEGKRPLGELRRRWKNNVKMGWLGMDSIALTRIRNRWRPPVNSVTKFRVTQNAGKFWTS